MENRDEWKILENEIKALSYRIVFAKTYNDPMNSFWYSLTPVEAAKLLKQAAEKNYIIIVSGDLLEITISIPELRLTAIVKRPKLWDGDKK
ncbi:hypothetical protein J7K74_03805 [Candidatus Woesearchaeota archaeon]|nr:hypothetical protein [Candidatus Woesearchaeota archaeon]